MGSGGYLESPSKSEPPPDSYGRGGRPRGGVSSAQPATASSRSSGAGGGRQGDLAGGGGSFAAASLAPLRTRATPPADGPLSSEAAWGVSSSPSAPASPSFFEKSANKLDELTLLELTPVADPERALSGALATLRVANVADRKELDWQAQHEALNDLR